MNLAVRLVSSSLAFWLLSVGWPKGVHFLIKQFETLGIIGSFNDGQLNSSRCGAAALGVVRTTARKSKSCVGP